MLLYGQLADVFGRHVMIQTGIFFVLIGSVLGAGAQDWPMLLLGRAFQGLGFAGLGTVSRIVLSDKVSLKEASTNNTIFMWLNGVSMGIGPLIGGYLTKVFLPTQEQNCLSKLSRLPGGGASLSMCQSQLLVILQSSSSSAKN